MRLLPFILVSSLCAVLMACQPPDAPPDASPTPDVPDLSLPVAYSGTVPCADCAGIAMNLRLDTDSTFALRRTYRGLPDDRDSVFFDAGDWAWEDSATLLLFDETGGSFFFLALGDTALRVLDRDKDDIASPLPYTLTRRSTDDTTRATPSR